MRPLLALRTGEPMSSAGQGEKTSFSSIQHEDETFPAYFSEQRIFYPLPRALKVGLGVGIPGIGTDGILSDPKRESSRV
jgi:hypothetical protein